MEREITRPAGLDLETPGRRDYYVALEHDSIWGDHLIPLTVFVGRGGTRRAQGLVAFGSNHGNEYEGPVALRHLLREIDLADVRGRIILVPVLNPAAFRAGTRDSSARRPGEPQSRLRRRRGTHGPASRGSRTGSPISCAARSGRTCMS